RAMRSSALFHPPASAAHAATFSFPSAKNMKSLIALLCLSLSPVFAAVRFEANRGQIDSHVQFIARAKGQQAFFTDAGVVLSPTQGDAVTLNFGATGTARW